MIMSLDTRKLTKYIQMQMNNFFPDGSTEILSKENLMEALERLEFCFNAISNRYFWKESENFFNHLHGDQYAMFLYLLSNTLYRNSANPSICNKLFLLNKALYGIDAYYEIELPRIFLFSHAGGTVLGRARYSDYFLVYQQCTVGSARVAKGGERGVFPVFGKHVSLYAGAKVLGACNIGDNCKISAHSIVMNKKLEPNTIYRGIPQSYETVKFRFPDNVWK